MRHESTEAQTHWEKLPERKPRGHPDNIKRVQLFISHPIKLINGQWYVKVKSNEIRMHEIHK